MVKFVHCKYEKANVATDYRKRVNYYLTYKPPWGLWDEE